ncbi:MAG: type III pantothenate kinase [Oscillospiraceae bacterium]|nr:type III pantothenate kinase [Oscillospiraceae bacterium]
MLLTVDVGNTNIVFAVFGDTGLIFESRIDTNAARMSDQYAIMLSDILRLYGVDASGVDGAVISSVVPPVTRHIAAAVKSLIGVEPMIVGPGIKSGLNIKIDNPGECGGDLVCCAVAAKELYRKDGDTPKPCIAIDLGTVTKILAIDKHGALIGGALAPGVGNGFKLMADTTALLPLVGVGVTDKAIGANTTDCIRSGILYGTACMLDGMIERFEAELGEVCFVVATGGFAEVIVQYCKREIVLNKRLVSEGLRIIYEKNR